MANPTEFDGFYVIYYTGEAGPGLAQIQLQEGLIVGADAAGGLWDGAFAVDSVNGTLKCNINIRLPPGATLATTGAAPKENETANMSFELPVDFVSKPFVTIELPIGKLNARFKKLRGG